MKVLVVGGGGREHALAWGLSRSREVREIVCAPGNAGIAALGRCVPVPVDRSVALAELAASEGVDLVVVGPEGPLTAGLADLIAAQGRPVFGCSRAAAELEGSKAYAKAFMTRHGIPTAAYGVFSDVPEAELFIRRATEQGAQRLVVKADGLAAGKGVILCEGADEAGRAVRQLLEERRLGEAGQRVLVEEFLEGREASLMAFVDGERVVPLPAAEDHKQRDDGDQGPMTGGMGTVSPTAVLDELTVARVVREILRPTAAGMVAEGRSFRGLLFAGLMLTPSGPRVLEYNCRFGDPETQVVLPRLDEDLGRLLHSVAVGRAPERVRVASRAAVCVVMAAGGYPGPYAVGQPIEGLELAAAMSDVMVFHAGTRRDETGRVLTAGGRVLGVTALGADLEEARARAYQAVGCIRFEGAQFRSDIGARRRA